MKKNTTVTQDNSSKSERGAALVEMALMVALVAVMGIVSLQALGTKISQSFMITSQHVGGTVNGGDDNPEGSVGDAGNDL